MRPDGVRTALNMRARGAGDRADLECDVMPGRSLLSFRPCDIGDGRQLVRGDWRVSAFAAGVLVIRRDNKLRPVTKSRDGVEPEGRRRRADLHLSESARLCCRESSKRNWSQAGGMPTLR